MYLKSNPTADEHHCPLWTLQAVFTALPLRTVNACLTLGRGWQRRLGSLRGGSVHSSSSLQPPLAQSQPSSPFALAHSPAADEPQPGLSQQQAWQQASLLDNRGGGDHSRGAQPSGVTFRPAEAPFGVEALPAAHHRGSTAETATQQHACHAKQPRLRGDQVFDLICVFIFLVAVRRCLPSPSCQCGTQKLAVVIRLFFRWMN